MADFGAFNVQTPQEVMAKLADQRRQVMTQGTVSQQRSQNIESALDGLFGNPQARAAARTQQALKSAQVKQNDGENDMDYEIRRLHGMRDAVADVSPETAAQINGRLLELSEAKFQRSRLQAADTRTETEFNQKQEDRSLDKMTDGSTYVYNQKTGEAEAFNLRDPKQTQAFLAARQSPGTTVITANQKWQLDLQNDAQANAMKLALIKAEQKASAGSDVSKVILKDAERASAGLLDVYAVSDRIFQVLETNPDALTAGSKGAKAFDSLATELGAAGRMASGGKTTEGQSIDDWMKLNSITNTRMQGLVTGLAYSIAKANDPAGRISDKDLAAAVQMVGGDNPNPAAIVANLNDQLTRMSSSIVDRIESGDPAVKEHLKDRLTLLTKRKDEFNQRMSNYAQGSRGKSATGAAGAAPDADGWVTLPSGVKIRAKK